MSRKEQRRILGPRILLYSQLCLFCCGPTVIWAADWPQYLGPNGDSSSSESIRTNWSEQPPVVVWRRNIGQGFSSITAAGGRLYTQEKRRTNAVDREYCIALDANTGDTLWLRNLDAADYSSLSGYDDRVDGPRSTPSVDGDRVYVSTSHLKLFALQSSDGSVIWSRDFHAEFSSTIIDWQNAASPLVVGDLIFVNCNAKNKRLMALRKTDGTTAWSVGDFGLTHATPILASLGGVAQVIFLTRNGLVSVLPEDGTVLWRLSFSPSTTSTASSPAVVGDYVFASAAYGSGTWIGRVTRSGASFSITQTTYQQGNAYQCHWASPVSVDGFLYGIPSPGSSQARLSCLDVAGGTNRWTQTKVGSDNIGFGSVIRSANSLIILTEDGELVLVKPNPAAYSELARFKILTSLCWNHASLANGRIYARNTSLSPEIVAVDAAPPIAPLPALVMEIERAFESNTLKLAIRPQDGTQLESNHAERIELVSTPEITPSIPSWSPVKRPFTATNGVLVTEIPLGIEHSCYLRVRDKTSNP